MEELKAAGFLDLSNLADVSVPLPHDREEGELDADEDPLDPEDLLDFAPEESEDERS